MIFPERYRVKAGRFASDPGESGMFIVNLKSESLQEPEPSALVLPEYIKRAPIKTEIKTSFIVIASNIEGWDHVSVTCPKEKRCPTWEEMSFIKDLFFEPEETAYQYHPPHSQYVNTHPYCLHIWKKQGFEMPLPPLDMIGFESDIKTPANEPE